MPLRKIGKKIVERKNDSSVSTQNFRIIYIFLWDGIPSYGSLPLPRHYWKIFIFAVLKKYTLKNQDTVFMLVH
jgi:hypothetical protein